MYKPDLESLDEPVNGTLELMSRDGKVLQTLQAQPYLLVPPKDSSGTQRHLVLGDEELSIYTAYEERRDAYLAKVAEYDKQLAAFMKAQAEKIAGNLTKPQLPRFTKHLLPRENGIPLKLRRAVYLQDARKLRSNHSRQRADAHQSRAAATECGVQHYPRIPVDSAGDEQ